MSGDRSPKPESSDPATDRERVLIVKPTALGDVAKAAACLATLRAAHPGARIDWLVHPAYADAIRHHPMLDGVVPFDRPGLRGLWRLRPGAVANGRRLRRALRSPAYSRVYDVQGLTRSAVMSRWTRAPVRVGFGETKEWTGFGYSVTHRVPTSLHTVDRMLGLLVADGLGPVYDSRLYVGEGDAAWAEAYRAERGLTEKRYVCLAPTSQGGSKCWPMEKFAEVASRAVAHPSVDERVVLIAAPHEHEKLKPITEALGANALFPQTTVGQSMALLQGAAAVVANDSGPLHLAVGLDRPTVAIFGPTDPALVGPYGRDKDVIQPEGITSADMLRYRSRKEDNSLIARVPVDAVWEKLETKLPA